VVASAILTRIFLRAFLPLFLPDPNHEDGRDLIHGENNRGKNEPIDVHVPDKEDGESGDPAGRKENRSRKQEAGGDFFHRSRDRFRSIRTGSPFYTSKENCFSLKSIMQMSTTRES